MSIGKVFSGAVSSNFVKSTVNFVKKNPLSTAGIAAGVGVTGLIAYKAATASRKKQTDFMNHMLLINPFLNPMGFMHHTINPKAGPNALDGIAGIMVDKNNNNNQKYYESLPPQEQVLEYYKNGGRGVNFDSAA